MVLRKTLPSLQTICLYSLGQVLLEQWNTNCVRHSEQFLKEMGVTIPYTMHNQLFDLMVDSQIRLIQNETTSTPISTISLLVNSIIPPTLHNLNLNCLTNIGFVQEEERDLFHSVLVSKLPYLGNLVEISFKTSGQFKPITLPSCTDKILQKIGLTCSELKSLDISWNFEVTDTGLRFLIPGEELSGCPNLVKLLLFECSVTENGIVALLAGLPKLKFLGFRETGQCLKSLHNNYFPDIRIQPLKLAHLNNLGHYNRSGQILRKLQCNGEFVNIISTLCPELNGLKIRVNDSNVWCLQNLTTITILELVFCWPKGALSSPGENTVQYLQLCGSKFVQLGLVCQSFSSLYLKAICEQCSNLKILKIKSSNFKCDSSITTLDMKKCVLMNLEKFYFTTGYNVYDLCHIPCKIFSYVLHKSCALTEVILTMKNTLLSNSFMEELFSSIETSKIKKIGIQVPSKRQASFLQSEVTLNLVTVEFLIEVCPELEELRQLLMWEVSSEEMEGLRRHLQLNNCALVI